MVSHQPLAPCLRLASSPNIEAAFGTASDRGCLEGQFDSLRKNWTGLGPQKRKVGSKVISSRVMAYFGFTVLGMFFFFLLFIFTGVCTNKVFRYHTKSRDVGETECQEALADLMVCQMTHSSD